MAGRAGAIIVDDINVTIPPSEVRSVTAHFVLRGQLNGLRGSSSPSQVTWTDVNRCMTGVERSGRTDEIRISCLYNILFCVHFCDSDILSLNLFVIAYKVI